MSRAWQGMIGVDECKIQLQDLYFSPIEDQISAHVSTVPCKNRQELLQAMSGGGRIGIDAPYISKDCYYQWFPQFTLCHIFERFHHVVFLGDDSLQQIYNGLNMLVSSNIASGTVKTWMMDQQTQDECRCDNQFQHEKCRALYIKSSDDSGMAESKDFHPASCPGHYSHSFYAVSATTTRADLADILANILKKSKSPEYKPVPIIVSISPYTASSTQTTSLLGSLVAATKSQSQSPPRKMPILWIGPTAPGHVDVRGRKTNQEIWDFDRVVEQVAYRQQLNRKDSVEVLKMWNLTVQASSWDGIRFGSKVALTQAMMVANWLSRLESS